MTALRLAPLAAALFLAACAAPSAVHTDGPASGAATGLRALPGRAHLVSGEARADARRHVSTLAAGDFLARQLEALGLVPAGNSLAPGRRSFFQDVPLQTARPAADTRTAPDWRPLTRHEVFHAVSIGLGGHPLAPTDRASFLAGGWLREGTATAAEGQCAGHPLHEVVAAMRREGSLPPVGTLAADFYGQNDPDATLQAGSLLDVVRLRRGVGAVRSLWDGGPDAFPDATGRTGAEVEAAWHAWLDAVPVRDAPDLAALREAGCG